MPDAPLRATATALPDDALIARLAVVLIDAATAVGRALTLAAVLDERLAKEDDTAAIAMNISGADAQIARARKMVADLQARRAEVARSCTAMRATLERK
jgi:hypothetical protein